MTKTHLTTRGWRWQEALLLYCVLLGMQNGRHHVVEGHCQSDQEGIAVSFKKVGDKFSIDNDQVLRVDLQVEWWDLNEFGSNLSIGLWSRNPHENSSFPKRMVDVDQSRGVRTVSFELESSVRGLFSKTNLSDVESCLPIWIALVKSNSDLKYVKCLPLNPFWMEKSRPTISKSRLSDIFFTGLELDSYFSPFSFCLRNFPWCDLVMGIRYLELSIDYQESDQNFYITVGQHQLLLSDVLNKVHNFLGQSQEIMVIKMVFNGSQYEELKILTMALFHDILITTENGLNPQLENLWKDDKRLLISWSQINNSKYFWENAKEISVASKSLFKKIGLAQAMKRFWTLTMSDYRGSMTDQQLNDTEEDVVGLSELENVIWNQSNIVVVESSLCSKVVQLSGAINEKRHNCPYINKMKIESDHKFSSSKRSIKFDDSCSPALQSSRVEVWPTVKAQEKFVEGKIRYRLLQINWRTCEVDEGDMVAIYENLPNQADVDRLVESREGPSTGNYPLFIGKPEVPQGLIISNISYVRPPISELSRGGCISHWVVYLRGRDLKAARCLSAHPKWIWENRETLSETPLRSLALPGTHNSGTYSLENGEDPVNSWIVCQDEDILTQLLLGIRYLDLRIAYYPESKELLWVNHDLVQWIPLQEVLEDIQTFAFLSPDPVILDVHRTPIGFDHDEAALLLVSLFNATLGDSLAPFSLGFQVTAAELWKSDKSLIVSYGPSWLRFRVPWLWPPVPHAWANTKDLDQLKSFIDESVEDYFPRKKMWAAMGHLTPNVWDVLFGVGSGIRGWAEKSATHLRKWVTESWGHKINIVAYDFLLSHDLIHTSIRLSTQKSKCPEKIGEDLCANK